MPAKPMVQSWLQEDVRDDGNDQSDGPFGGQQTQDVSDRFRLLIRAAIHRMSYGGKKTCVRRNRGIRFIEVLHHPEQGRVFDVEWSASVE